MADEPTGVWVVWSKGNYGGREIGSVHLNELDALRVLNQKQDYEAESAEFLEFGVDWSG